MPALPEAVGVGGSSGGAFPMLGANTGGGAGTSNQSGGAPAGGGGGTSGAAAGAAGGGSLDSDTAYASLFDGKSLEGWVYDPKNWSIRDEAITGTGCWCMAYTKKDYAKYRLLMTARVKSPIASPKQGSGNMLGIEIWGARHANADFSPKGTIHIVPPLSWSWDYLHNTPLAAEQSIKLDPGFSWNDWNMAEILSDVAQGKFRMAVNGVEVFAFTAKVLQDWHVGPIGLLDHASGSVVQYKDIKVEEDPERFELTTLHP